MFYITYILKSTAKCIHFALRCGENTKNGETTTAKCGSHQKWLFDQIIKCRQIGFDDLIFDQTSNLFDATLELVKNSNPIYVIDMPNVYFDVSMKTLFYFVLFLNLPTIFSILNLWNKGFFFWKKINKKGFLWYISRVSICSKNTFQIPYQKKLEKNTYINGK